MKNIFLLLVSMLLIGIQSYAQTGVAINTSGNVPDTSAMLDVSSTTKGILIPRMTQAQRTAIALPAKGLLVYQNDGTEGFYYYDGSVWTNLSLVNFNESNFLYDSKYGVKLLAKNDAQTNVDFVISPKGNGGIIAQQPDGTATGGDNRGTYAVDLQRYRNLSTQVASGGYSTIGGGRINTSAGLFSTISGGQLNTASEFNSTIAGGANNTAGGISSFIGGGQNNTSSGDFSLVGGGRNNTAPSYGEAVFGYYATDYTPEINGTISPIATDRLFNIGNGTASARSNAFTILKNANTTIGGSLTINGNGTNASYLFPETRGTTGQVLQTDGSGGTSWTAPASGTVTGVTGTAPIVSSGGNTPAISISAATTSAAGSMSAADKTKLDGIAANANNYTHPTGDGNLHVPATGTGNNGKVLTAGATAGSLSWTTLPAAPVTSVAGKTGAVTLVNSDVGLGNVENTALSTWAGSSSITTLGTIATGTWNGTTISLAKGGTGATTKTAAFDALSPMTTQGDIVYGGTGGTGTRLAKGTAGQVLTMNSGATAPQWSTPTTGTVTGVTGTAPIVSSGGNAPAISISAATTSAAGSMSAADKTKLDGLVNSQWTSSGSNIYYGTGNVGIGSTDLSQKLNVDGSVLIPSGESYWIGSASGTGNRLRLHQTNSNAYIDWGEQNLYFRSGVSSSTNRVVFTGEGKVGIGTTAPKALLDLGNSTSNRKIILYSSADNDHQFYGFGLNNDVLRFQLPTTTANFNFYAATSTTASNELFRIQGDGNVVAQGQIKNVTEPTDIKDAATKGYVDELETRVNAMENMLIDAGLFTVNDAVGNRYNTVKIGTQIWMTQNLQTTKYNDGTAIPLVIDSASWNNLSTPAYCWYNNDSSTYASTYGALYNWYTVETSKLCPTGWHLPTDGEWTTLFNYLVNNGYDITGLVGPSYYRVAKSLASTSNWTISSVTGAVGNTDFPAMRNKTGFTAVPGSLRQSNGHFYPIGLTCNMWSSSAYSSTNAFHRHIAYNEYYFSQNNYPKNSGFSVRCLKD